MDVSTGLAIFQTAFQLAGLLVNERDSQKAAAIKIDLTQKIMDAQTQFVQMQSTVIEQQRTIAVLEESLRKLQSQATENERYVLAKLGASGQFFAYRLRPSSELDQPSSEVEHFVCQPCLEGGRKAVLNHNGDGYWWCPVCRHGAQVDGRSADVVFSGERRGFSGF